jgi:hypothetical protein
LLGLGTTIHEAVQSDRAGSGVLEVLLHSDAKEYVGFENLGLKEVIVTTCWYLWWIRRRRTHNEDVMPLFKCIFSILSIVANAAKMAKPSGSTSDAKWTRPNTRQVKLNVDAAFHSDISSGAVGAVIRDY